MNDMSATIVAKSDQINASDLIGAPRTITIREVRIKSGEDQPVSILIDGDQKAFRPCKGVRRLLVRVWGPDASKYIGHSMTLFCDPSVTYAGKQEGGIRVSHMSGLDEKIVEFMRTSRASTKPYTVEPLKIEPLKIEAAPADEGKAQAWADKFIAALGRAPDLAKLDDYAGKQADKIAGLPDDLRTACETALADARSKFPPSDEPASEEEELGW